MKKSFNRIKSQRGSVLIVALLFSAIIAIALTTYMQLAGTSMKIANRAFYNNGAMNLAENGLEEAMYCINQLTTNSNYTWPGWSNNGTGSSSDAWRQFPTSGTYSYDQNTTGIVRVFVYNYKGDSAPKIVARSTITLGGAASTSIEKWIEVTLSKTSKFANGLVAKNSIVFNGTNTSVDSWNSDPDNSSATAAIPYSAGVRSDNGSVGSISVSVGAVLVKQADVWGYVSTGGSNPTSAVGSNGSVLGTDSVYDASTWTSTNVDPTRVSTDFSATFDAVTVPTQTANKTTITYTDVPVINSDTILPATTGAYAASPSDDGYYYYRTTKIDLTNETLSITGKVVLVLTDTDTAIDVGGGSGVISVAKTGGSLITYGPGDVKLAGNGVSNGTDTSGDGSISDSEAGQPIQFQFWGTKTSGTQNITITGNGTFSGIIYAPQGSVTINGNGSVSGSVVANNITLSGNANFHYDESLGNFGGNNPYRVSKWKELTTSTDRAAYSSVLSF